MLNRIITISREAGSGGRTIGKTVAEKLGIQCYDADLIREIAEKSGYSEEYVKEKSESASDGWLAAIFSDHTMQFTAQDKLWITQKQVIEDLAEKGPCVIVGRCADFILKDKADCLTVFVHADKKKRAARVVEKYGESEKNVDERIREKDKRRAAYYRFYTDMRWGQAQNYQICLDSGKTGIDKCVDLICQLY